MLSVHLLGPVQALRDGELLPVPGGKTNELLARLAVEPGAPVRTDTLVEDLWGHHVDRNTLQAKVSQLRRALGSSDAVRSAHDAYVLHLPRDAVDAARLEELAERVAEARLVDDLPAVVACAGEALALFVGDVLAGQGDWAVPYRTAWEEVRWGLVQDLMAARVGLGSGGEIVADLERLVAQQPLREGLWVSLVTALYRTGRQADALQAFQRVRGLLADELGLDPGPELRALERQILEHSDAWGAAVVESDLTAPGNLTRPRGALVGRDVLLADVTASLGSESLVTLVGPAGVGKTRLANQAAWEHQPTGGAWMVRLDAVGAGGDLLRLVAETLHVAGGAAALQARLRGAPTLLVLDNAEHVVADAAALADELLRAAPTLRIIVTSQVPLGIEQECVVAVRPLALDDAVTLFVDHARRQRAGADVAAKEAVTEICRSLDGLPLAIELAAARTRSLPVPEIARRLDDRFGLLRDPSSNRPDRRRALEAALAWSYELLFPDDQRGLWALSVFADGAGLAALEQVLSALDVPAVAVLDTVTRLVDRSLVVLDDAHARYRLLDSVKAYAEARLEESGLGDAARAAHAGWYADRADECRVRVRTADQAACLDHIRAERSDVDQALAWCARHDAALGVRLALGLGWAWVVLGDGSVGASRLRAAVGKDASRAARVEAALVSAWLEASAGDLGMAASDLAVAESLATGPAEAADLALHAAFLAIQQGRPEVVLERGTSAVACFRELGASWGEAAAGVLVAYGALMVADVATARRSAEEAVRILSELGDRWGLVHAGAILGGVAEIEGRLEDAGAAFRAAAEACVEMGFPGQAALHRASWARVLIRAGDRDADRVVRWAAADAAAVADARLTATLRIHLAQSARRRGEVAQARELLEANARWYAGAGGGDLALLNSVLLASLGDDDVALDSLAERARADHDTTALMVADDARARRATARGDHDRARALRKAADEASAGASTDFVDRVDAWLADTAGR